MGWSGHHMIDPFEIETRFAVEDSMAYLDSIFEELTEESQAQINQVKELMNNLPTREADFIDLYFFRKLKQTDIANLFGVSQPTVCYRLRRATDRIQFLLQIPQVDVEQLEKDLRGFLADPLDIQIMLLMKDTTCQSEVGKRLGVSQGKVRHRFQRSVKRMRVLADCDSESPWGLYVRFFEFIESNLNILREVQRPAWDSQATHILD